MQDLKPGSGVVGDPRGALFPPGFKRDVEAEQDPGREKIRGGVGRVGVVQTSGQGFRRHLESHDGPAVPASVDICQPWKQTQLTLSRNREEVIR